jgi:transposase
MTVEDIDLTATLAQARELLAKEAGLSPTFKSVVELLLVIITLLSNRLGLNSRNSSKPPSSDSNRQQKSNKSSQSNNKPGGQAGRTGAHLGVCDDPDETVFIPLNREDLPRGKLKAETPEIRQVFDIRIQRWVTEYQAEVFIDENGKRYVAPFPDTVPQKVQYGSTLKAHAVYLSQFQLLPYLRIQNYFLDQVGIPISVGSLFNFNRQAYERLEVFDETVKQKLIDSALLHVDETGINVNGRRIWLHCAASDLWTYYYPHQKRGKEAMDDMGILPTFTGTACHDHWKPYYRYTQCQHALCNAHHLRELERAYEHDGQQWAYDMQLLLVAMNRFVVDAGGELDEETRQSYLDQYHKVLNDAENECPEPKPDPNKKHRGRIKRSKARNLLERLKHFADDVLRFTTDKTIPFTNNQGENDIRMTKVQQKISGCFRSMEGAAIFCRNRSYLSSCRKQGKSATEALKAVFEGDPMAFLTKT